MADDSKNKQKGKHEAKEQRRKRQARQHVGAVERKQENQSETSKATAPETPAHQQPGPEFYKGLKRETDEILKISEEENSKYRNKEIQSNWAKYEMPIESYEEMDEQEHLGADYETLIQAPLSVGTHFQFKHEKSWDVTSGPSPYQKYFDIDMGNLVVALSTIPFYERNSIDKSIFTDSDFLSMDHRAAKYRQKYYNGSKNKTVDGQNKNSESVNSVKSDKHTERCDNITEQLFKFKDLKLQTSNTQEVLDNKHQKPVCDVPESKDDIKTMEKKNTNEAKKIDEIKHSDDINIVKKLESSTTECYDSKINVQNPIIADDKNTADNKLLENPEIKLIYKDVSISVVTSKSSVEVAHSQKETSKPIIESPEDLEKWLDDFLDN